MIMFKVLTLLKPLTSFPFLMAKFSTENTLTSIKFIPRRAVLYIPGNDERKLNKISSLNADCIVLDCEDGVALSKKAEARNTIVKYLELKDSFKNKDCSVRINCVSSPLWEDDLQTIMRSPTLPQTLHLPKVESVQEIKQFSEKLESCLKMSDLKEKLRLIIFVESAKALLNLSSICEAAIHYGPSGSYTLDGVVFGSDDYCADIGATRSSEADELLFARQWTVAVAKSFKIQAIDVVYIDYKDEEGLKKQSEQGAKFGFTGKQIIHPSQIDTVLKAFTPSEEKINWAKGLVDAFEEHQNAGKGAFTYKGSMIDMPLLLQAKNILQMAKNS